MNILPKKSWHVRNKDNVARVRRDEAKALEEEQEVAKRKALAEQEARIRILRERSKEIKKAKQEKKWDLPQEPVDDVQTEETSPGHKGTTEQPDYETLNTAFPADKHINLFEDFEKSKKTQGANKEYEAEKKKAQESYEKKIGYLTYLGQSASSKFSEKPWYEKVPNRKTDSSEPMRTFSEQETMKISDPLISMTKYLDKKKHAEDLFFGRTKEVSTTLDNDRMKRRPRRHQMESTVGQMANSQQSSWSTKNERIPSRSHEASTSNTGKKRKHDSESDSDTTVDGKKQKLDDKNKKSELSHLKQKKSKKEKKRKHKRRKKSKRESLTPEKSVTVSKPTIEQLRAARMEREAGERQRSIELITRLQGHSTPARSVIDERTLTYNTRYMPSQRGKR